MARAMALTFWSLLYLGLFACMPCAASPVVPSATDIGTTDSGIKKDQAVSQAPADPSKVDSQSAAEVGRDNPPVAATECRITGKITDITGKGINKARVLLIKEGAEHLRKELETGADGSFTLDGVEPGRWQVTVSAADMLSYSETLDLNGGETKSINASLEELEAEDVMRVTGKRTLIHPEKIGSTTNVTHDTVYQYRSGNNLHELIESTPGVITDTMGNIIVRGEHNAINYQLDGVYIPEAAGVLQQSNFVTPRSLQSMQVDIGGYQASDGGGPMGAFARMKSLPITAAPTFKIGQQVGGPLAGNIYFNTSGALSQDKFSVLNRVRFDASGSFLGTRLGTVPPLAKFTHDNRVDINVLMKLEFLANENNTFKVTGAINQTYLEVPTSKASYRAGVRAHQQDRQDFIIVSWKHRFKRFFDESNLHVLNAFYGETYHSRDVFDPDPVINGGQPLQSIAPNASRQNYIFGAQGNITKTLFNTHRLEGGFFTEYRKIYTDFGASYYNNDFTLGSALPVGTLISPFTGNPIDQFNPAFTNAMGKFRGSRYLQSAYFQDTWRPMRGWLRRLTVDTGVRVDVDHAVYGNTHLVEQVLNTIPGIAGTFSPGAFDAQHLTQAQASGRYGLSYVLNPKTVYRASYSDLFSPASVDIFSTPPSVSGLPINGVYNGTVRPNLALRGRLVDTSIERQIGSRFMTRTNLFYKYLTNYGDSGVIGNSILYNRQTVAAQEAYGVETRVELRKSRDGYGLNGWISNTWQIALLRGSKQVTGGIYNIQTTPIENKYPDHDRRESLEAALGWIGRKNWWVLADYKFLTGLQDERDPGLVGPHPFRSPWLNIFGISGGYAVPKTLVAKTHHWLPDSVDVRCENLLNNRGPTNLGSPFQGTRYLLPFRFLVGCAWHIGPQEYKFSQKPTQTASPAAPPKQPGSVI